ncbi:MAG: phosphoserine phosphatase SerB [Bordetella sp.]|nr:MAG: phosphoserine phosphatase SerB [Bordetella sp.]
MINSYRIVIQSPYLKNYHIEYLLPYLNKDSIIENINQTAACIKNAECNKDTRIKLFNWAKENFIDIAFVQNNNKLENYKILAIDMDSTLINIETIDEIACVLGLRKEISKITNAAMNGYCNFQESLKQRVSLLKGTPISILNDVYHYRLKLNTGSKKLIDSAKKAGLITLLISGGFTFFTKKLHKLLNFDMSYANDLEVLNGKITGNIREPLLDSYAKAKYLIDISKKYNISHKKRIAVGDGANDLKMFKAAGFSIAYHAKPIVREQANHFLDFCGLDGILNLFDTTI